MEKIKELLALVEPFVKKTEENKSSFNMFGICGVNHYENTHSSILVEFLNPKGSHGFKEKFLQAFIDLLMTTEFKNNEFHFAVHNATVKTEYNTNGEGRIDILIWNEKKQALIIENKIYAADQNEQLKRYSNFAKTKFDDFKILYLTLEGYEASENSAGDIDYTQISYHSTILKWLENCIIISKDSPLVRETIKQYIIHLKFLTGQDMNSKENKKLVEFLSKEEQINAAFLIGKNLSNVKNNIINNTLLPQIKSFQNESNFIESAIKNDFDWVNTSWASFTFRKETWKYFQISIEFQAKGLRNCIIGFVHINSKQTHDNTFKELNKRMTKTSNTWAYEYFDKFRNWEEIAFLAILNGEMIKHISAKVKDLLTVVEDLEM